MRQAASVTLLWNWMEISLLYMNYIANSKEQPLGKVEHTWCRFEFQDTIGNLPHIHSLIWLEDGTEAPKDTEDCIRGSIMELICPDEIDQMIADGLLSCAEEVMDVKELASKVLLQVCSSRYKKRVGLEDGELRC